MSDRSPLQRAALAAGGAFALALTSACTTTDTLYADHWNASSVVPRMTYAFTGYDYATDGPYIEKVWQDRHDINVTLRRHFLNDNPERPFRKEVDPSLYEERPPLSIWPNPANYFHATAIFVGGALSGYDAVAAFIPIPIDALWANIKDDQGQSEFARGLAGDGEPASRHSRLGPPAVEDFQVKHTDRPAYFADN